jgi:hypothetical protein
MPEDARPRGIIKVLGDQMVSYLIDIGRARGRGR